jgi:hypothetical protein
MAPVAYASSTTEVGTKCGVVALESEFSLGNFRSADASEPTPLRGIAPRGKRPCTRSISTSRVNQAFLQAVTSAHRSVCSCGGDPHCSGFVGNGYDIQGRQNGPPDKIEGRVPRLPVALMCGCACRCLHNGVCAKARKGGIPGCRKPRIAPSARARTLAVEHTPRIPQAHTHARAPRSHSCTHSLIHTLSPALAAIHARARAHRTIGVADASKWVF